LCTRDNLLRVVVDDAAINCANGEQIESHAALPDLRGNAIAHGRRREVLIESRMRVAFMSESTIGASWLTRMPCNGQNGNPLSTVLSDAAPNHCIHDRQSFAVRWLQ